MNGKLWLGKLSLTINKTIKEVPLCESIILYVCCIPFTMYCILFIGDPTIDYLCSTQTNFERILLHFEMKLYASTSTSFFKFFLQKDILFLHSNICYFCLITINNNYGCSYFHNINQQG